MLGTTLQVIVILSYPPQLQEEHKDPYVLDKDNNIIQGNVENKSCSIWQKIMVGTIPDVKVIFPYPQSANIWKNPYA